MRVPYPCLKRVPVWKYCYDFTVVHDDCKVAYERHWGCCEGIEYSCTDACLGWFGVYASGNTRCFDEPLSGGGKCSEGNSLPPGGTIPGGTLDPGTVAPHPSGPTLSVRQLPAPDQRVVLTRLGTCGRCFRAAVFLAAAAWTVVAGAHMAGAPAMAVGITGVAAALFTALVALHILAAAIKWSRNAQV